MSKASKIISDLAQLDPEELKKVAEILASMETEEVVEQKPPQKKRRTRKKKVTATKNKFLEMNIKEKADPTDTKITRAIKSGKIQITERDRPLNYVNATCTGCKQTNEISASLAYRDMETKKYVYVCNDCLVSRRNA